jgi:hypothetical protein
MEKAGFYVVSRWPFNHNLPAYQDQIRAVEGPFATKEYAEQRMDKLLEEDRSFELIWTAVEYHDIRPTVFLFSFRA